MNESNTKSIVDMAMGSIKERIDYEMAKVLDNIVDPNTAATKKRQIIVTLDITPDSERTQLQVKATAKSKLEPTNPVSVSLYVTDDEDGNPAAIEMLPQVPGQTVMDGGEMGEPSVLKLVKQA